MTDLNFNLCGGIHSQLRSSISEEGNGRQFCADLLKVPDKKNIYGIGATYDKSENKGGVFYNNQTHERFLLSLSRGRQMTLAGEPAITENRLYTGFSKVDGQTSLELGTEVSGSLLWKASDQWRVGIGPYFGMLTSRFDSESNEKISLLSLRLGVSARLMFLDDANKPEAPDVTDQDVIWSVLSNFHRLGRTYNTAMALSGPSSQAQEYAEELFGEGGLPSARMENLGTVLGLNMLLNARETANDLSLQLKANEDQRTWIVGSKIIASAGYFIASGGDKSPTMMAQGVADSLGLLRFWLSQSNNERDSFLYSSLLNALAFAGGLTSKNSKEGQALLQGSQQAMMATAWNPTPGAVGQKDSHHFVYQLRKDSGRYVGYRKTSHLPSEGLYSSVALLGQAVPGPTPIQQTVDETTARDPLYEGAKAMTTASLGLETQTGEISWSAGVRGLLLFGEGPKPVPGVGAEQQMLLTWGNQNRFELGISLSEDLVDGELQTAVSGVTGVRF